MGFSLYDDENNSIYDRPVTWTSHGEHGNIPVSSEIAAIVFSGISDGFHGSFIVRDSDGAARAFHCTNCLPNSPTTDLKNIYIDSDMNRDLDLPDTANCQNSCRFVPGELTTY